MSAGLVRGPQERERKALLPMWIISERRRPPKAVGGPRFCWRSGFLCEGPPFSSVCSR